jgi:non-specific serine/threonine protein kinase
LTGEKLDQARQYIEAGLDIVGDNALLFEKLGYIYWQYYNVGIETDEKYLGKVEECARKIFDLEADSPRAHYLLALLHTTRGHAQLSVNHFKKVLQADPNRGDALRMLAIMYGNVGKLSAAAPLIKRFSMINPLEPHLVEESILQLWEGKFEQALETSRRLSEMKPDDVRSRFLHSLCLVYSQNYDAAIQVCSEFAKYMPEHTWARYAHFMKYALKKDEKNADIALTSKLRNIAERDAHYSWYVAVGYAILGDRQKTLDWLENAVDMGFINYPFLSEYDPFLKNLHGEKRFERLMQRVKSEWENFEV